MTINEWWASDSAERYWMEITNRNDIGANLLAPKRDDAGNAYWSYTLVHHVKPGDLVLHWDKNAAAIVGFSIVAGPAVSSTIYWQSRGTYGRTHAPSGNEPAWKAPLGGFVELRQPVTQERFRALESRVRRVKMKLATKTGGPLYFPFATSDKRPLRAAQGYLTKFPRDLVEAIPELRQASDLGHDAPDEDGSGTTNRSVPNDHDPRRPNTGRLRDAKRKRAIEIHAVNTTMRLWESDGYMVEDVGLVKPWDVTATKPAGAELPADEVHIEVKGSSGTRYAVDLTDGEVRHAEETHATNVLVVVDQIRVTADNICSGGRVRVWMKWTPERSVLVPTAYRYPLPDGWEEA